MNSRSNRNRIGERLGNYRLIRHVGEGGFADVYLGEHIHLSTQAAIKVLHTRLTSNDVEAFRAEARTIARLSHQHIVRVLDFGVEGKTPFLVMDYAEGGTVRGRYRKGERLPLETIVSYVQQVAGALQYAHDEKIIHRDIKPENMLLDQSDRVLLSDFGIAAAAQSSRYQSDQGVVGTVAYMAPEQIRGRLRPASDQYALGVVVYEWLCGERPFQGSFTEVCTQHIFAEPPPLHEKIPIVSPDVERVVMIALAKDPRQRFASVEAFATALAQASRSEPVAWPSVSPADEEKDRWDTQTESFPPAQVALAERVVNKRSAYDTVPGPDTLYKVNRATVLDTSQVRIGRASRRMPPINVIIFSIALIVFLAGAGGIFYTVVYQPSNHPRDPITATALARQSATAQARATLEKVYGQATSGTPALEDPLTNQNENNWDILTYDGGGGCSFVSNAYHATMPQAGYFASCMARATNFSDFAFEVEMTIVQGNGGGLIFRTRDDGGTYRFRVNQDGSYDLVNQKPHGGLITSTSSAIRQGLNQMNVLTVVARGKDIYLYVNRKLLSHVNDDATSSGQIGFFAIDSEKPTDVMFRNLKVWKL